MIHIPRKAVNLNGQDVMSPSIDIEYSKNRTMTIYGEIDNELAAEVNSALRCLARDSNDDIILYIQSPGGSVTAGLSIYDTIQSIRCDVVTVASGMAASMAAIILMAGKRGKRWVQPNGEILIHQPLGGTRGQASDIRIQADHILKLRDRINEIISNCTGQSIEKVEIDTERDNIMSAYEALEYGLVDRIGDPIEEW